MLTAATARARALIATSVAVLLAGTAGPVDAAVDDAKPMTLDHAVRAVRAGRDIERAVAALDAYARQGNGRACVLLGTMLLEGTLVPKNAPLGLAFVRLGSETTDLVFNQSVQQKVLNLVLLHESTMSGAELIASDRLVGSIIEDTNRYLLEQYGEALAAALHARPAAISPAILFGAERIQLPLPAAGGAHPFARRGCAASAGPQCPPLPPNDGRTSCTGDIGLVDMSPSRRGSRHVVVPTYPTAARRAGTEGTVTIAAHLDSSGLLCSATVIDPRESTRTLAAAALDAAVRSQFDPATRDGEPVESLRLLVFNFVLTD